MAGGKKNKQRKKKTKASPNRAGDTSGKPVDAGPETQQPCPILVSRDIAVGLQIQILIDQSPSKAMVPPDLTELNARTVARQIERLDWNVPQDKEGVYKSFLTLEALMKCGLPMAVVEALLKALDSSAGDRADIISTDDVSGAAISIIDSVMDPNQRSMEMSPVDATLEDDLGKAVLANYERFAGADESEVVRFLAKSSIGKSLVVSVCQSLAKYLVLHKPAGYEYFFDVADTESEQTADSFKVECQKRVLVEETCRIYDKVLHMRALKSQ